MLETTACVGKNYSSGPPGTGSDHLIDYHAMVVPIVLDREVTLVVVGIMAKSVDDPRKSIVE